MERRMMRSLVFHSRRRLTRRFQCSFSERARAIARFTPPPLPRHRSRFRIVCVRRTVRTCNSASRERSPRSACYAGTRLRTRSKSDTRSDTRCGCTRPGFSPRDDGISDTGGGPRGTRGSEARRRRSFSDAPAASGTPCTTCRDAKESRTPCNSPSRRSCTSLSENLVPGPLSCIPTGSTSASHCASPWRLPCETRIAS
eukprot:31270-Pelagococcus_subviridis.AAC.34